MADHRFYSTENRHNEREIRILSVGSLVSKPPAKEKRISIKAQMILSGKVNMGAPGWLDSAYMYVAQHGDTVTPDIEFKGYDIDLSVENLFGENVGSKNCVMRAFEITTVGKEETPDVVLNFTMRFQFSTKLWDWLGQYVGDSVWARFTPPQVDAAAPVENEEDGTELDDGENDDDDPIAEEEPEERIVVMPPQKSGPKELSAFHEQEVEKELTIAEEVEQIRRGRGRPKGSTNKPKVDPLTVTSPVMARSDVPF